MGDTQNIINLEEGWNNEIKTKALDPLEVRRRGTAAALPFRSFCSHNTLPHAPPPPPPPPPPSPPAPLPPLHAR